MEMTTTSIKVRYDMTTQRVISVSELQSISFLFSGQFSNRKKHRFDPINICDCISRSKVVNRIYLKLSKANIGHVRKIKY